MLFYESSLCFIKLVVQESSPSLALAHPPLVPPPPKMQTVTPDKERLFPFYLIILFIVQRLKTSTYELYKASETCAVCLSIQQLSCVSSTRKSQLSESNKKSTPPHPNITSPTKQHPSPSSPVSFKLWQHVSYLFFIFTKQRFENNVNF